MREQMDTSPGWLQVALGIVASFLSGGVIVKLYNSWLNRRKPAAEIHLTEETAGGLRVRSSAEASESMMAMMKGLAIAQRNIDARVAERDVARLARDTAEEVAAQNYNEAASWKKKHELASIEVDHHLKEIARLHALLVLHSIEYSEADKVRMQRMEQMERERLALLDPADPTDTLT